MPISGSGVGDPNFVLRFSIIVFIGIILFSSVLFWKSQLLFVAEYQDLPVTHEQIRIKKENKLKQQKITANFLKNQAEN